MEGMERHVAKYENQSPEPEVEVYIKQLLESIDSEELTRFLSEQLRPAGFDEVELRNRFFRLKETTILEQIPSAVAWADGERINFEPKNFFVGVHKLQAHIEQKITPGNHHDREVQFYEIAKIQLLNTFIHEQLHHLTFTGYYINKEERKVDGVERVFTRQAGVERQILKREVRLANTGDETDELVAFENRHFFRGLNEGLTELIAQKLTVEYMRQYAVINDQNIVREAPSFLTESGAYKKERYMVEQLAAVFAEMTDVPYDIVLKSFYREYVTNGHLLPPEFVDVIAEYLPDSVDKDNLESGIASLTHSMTAESFENDDTLAKKLERLVAFLPEDKATHCQQTLTEIQHKYYPDRSSKQ